MALSEDGGVWAWGHNNFGQLGDGTTTDRTLPIQIVDLREFGSVDAGYDHAVAVQLNGAVWTWGGNAYGQLGDGAAWRTMPARSSITFLLKGDLNGDSAIDLRDAILALQVLSRRKDLAIREDYPSSGRDVNGGARIGMEEAIYILQFIGGYRI
jgi:hypothetical protein